MLRGVFQGVLRGEGLSPWAKWRYTSPVMGIDEAEGSLPADHLSEKISLLVDSIDSISKLEKPDFLKGVFDAAFKLIPEAQKGSLYELRGGSYVPIFAKGYDMAILSRMCLAPDKVFIDFECRNPLKIEACESRIMGRNESEFTPEQIEIFKALGTYSGFVSLHAQIQVKGDNLGLICLENFEGQGFSSTSKEILKFYACLISSFYSKLIEQEQKTLLLSGKIDSLRQLAAGVAHEVNTPLGAIQSSVTSLSSRLDPSLRAIIGLGGAFSEGEKGLLEEVLDRKPALEEGLSLSGPALRRLRAEIEAAGLRRAQELAELLALAGYEEGDEELKSFLRSSPDEGFIDLLLDLNAIQQSLAVAGAATRKLAKIVELLRFYTKIERGRELERLDLARQVEGIVRLMAGELPPEVEVVRDFGPAPAVSGDPDALGQVWFNLIKNAAQAMGGRGRITLKLRGHGASATLSVSDEGPGIAEAARAHLFEPFFTTKAPGEGSGLGLSIAKAIVESCSGSIGFESSSRGATFTVELPAWEGN